MQGFLRMPDERTKKKVVLCPFPRPELGWDWIQGLEGVKVVGLGLEGVKVVGFWRPDSSLWLSVLWQPCPRHPVLSLPTLI